MRRSVVYATALLALAACGTAAEAQQSYHVNGPLRLNVRPRDWLNPGNTVAPYSAVNPASAYGQTVSYLNNPPYAPGHTVGFDNLPDAVNNGPFAGALNPFGPVEYGQPFWFR